MKKCKYCQTEIPKKAKVCPNCKRTLKGGGCLTFLVGFFLFMIACTILSVVIEQNELKSTNTTVKPTTEEKEAETIADKYGLEEYITTYLGVKNPSFSIMNYREWDDGAGFTMVENTFEVDEIEHTYLARVGKDKVVYKLTIDDEDIFSADADTLFDYMEKYPVEE